MTSINASMGSFLVSTTLLLALRSIAPALGLIDKPGGRKTHHGDVPVVGGLAMFGGLLIACLGLSVPFREVLGLLGLGAFLVFLGVLDDRFDLPARVRLFAHVSASIGLIYVTGLTVPALGDLFGDGSIQLGVLSTPFTVLAVVALINGFNMLDGLDGLAASVGLVAFGCMFVLASTHGIQAAVVLSGGMVGATLAFAFFNLPMQFNRGLRTFMGDAGSTLFGFLLAAVCLVLMNPRGPALSPVLLLWILPVPVFELLTSTIRRIVNGLPPTQADANHFHHVLLRSGFSVRAIALLYFLVSAMGAFVAVWSDARDVPDVALLLGFIGAYAIWVFGVYRAHRIAPKLPGWLRRLEPGSDH